MIGCINISHHVKSYSVRCDPFRFEALEMVPLSLRPHYVWSITCIRSVMNYVHCNVSAVYHSHVCDSPSPQTIIILTTHTDSARIRGNPSKLPERVRLLLSAQPHRLSGNPCSRSKKGNVTEQDRKRGWMKEGILVQEED